MEHSASPTATTPSEDLFNDEEAMSFDIGSEEFTSDHFRMYEFKVKPCPKQKPHDWTQCPFAHCGERATRRDPLVYKYSGSACAEFRRNGTCSRGDSCPYAHGVFECWLHPGKYKTQMCSDTKNCKRPVCFFAHHPSELRTSEAQVASGVGKADGFVQKAPPPVRMGPHSTSCLQSVPNTRQQKVPSMMEMAARMEDLQKQIHQTSTPPGSPMANNPLTMFINSVIQLQQSMPGINIMQLLQAIIGSQPPSSPSPPMQQHDLYAALMQTQASFHAQKQQAQVQAHAVDLMRQMHDMNIRRPQPNAHSEPGVLRAISMSSDNTPLGDHSGPFSNRLSSMPSMGNSSSLCGMSTCHDTSHCAPYHMMPPRTSNGQYGVPMPAEAPNWMPGMDAEPQEPSSRGSEHSARSCEVKSAAGAFDMWSMGDSIWSSKKQVSSDGGFAETIADKPSGGLLRHMCNHFGSKDSLLDVLPRDLSDLKLNDVTNNVNN